MFLASSLQVTPDGVQRSPKVSRVFAATARGGCSAVLAANCAVITSSLPVAEACDEFRVVARPVPLPGSRCPGPRQPRRGPIGERQPSSSKEGGKCCWVGFDLDDMQLRRRDCEIVPSV